MSAEWVNLQGHLLGSESPGGRRRERPSGGDTEAHGRGRFGAGVRERGGCVLMDWMEARALRPGEASGDHWTLALCGGEGSQP